MQVQTLLRDLTTRIHVSYHSEPHLHIHGHGNLNSHTQWEVCVFIQIKKLHINVHEQQNYVYITGYYPKDLSLLQCQTITDE